MCICVCRVRFVGCVIKRMRLEKMRRRRNTSSATVRYPNDPVQMQSVMNRDSNSEYLTRTRNVALKQMQTTHKYLTNTRQMCHILTLNTTFYVMHESLPSILPVSVCVCVFVYNTLMFGLDCTKNLNKCAKISVQLSNVNSSIPI